MQCSIYVRGSAFCPFLVRQLKLKELLVFSQVDDVVMVTMALVVVLELELDLVNVAEDV